MALLLKIVEAHGYLFPLSPSFQNNEVKKKEMNYTRRMSLSYSLTFIQKEEEGKKKNKFISMLIAHVCSERWNEELSREFLC